MTALKSLENLELAGITFIRGYIQFLFDGPVFNTYTLPKIKIGNTDFAFTQYGYYDNLCTLIGKHVLSAYEDDIENRIIIEFESGIELSVSLKLEDRQCAEAAMLQVEQDGKWNVW